MLLYPKIWFIQRRFFTDRSALTFFDSFFCLIVFENPPNPGEQLLNSTVQLIEHFTSCYESLKTQLQDERIKARENMLISRIVDNSSTNLPISRMTYQRPLKQARLETFSLTDWFVFSRLSFQTSTTDGSSCCSTTESSDYRPLSRNSTRLSCHLFEIKQKHREST